MSLGVRFQRVHGKRSRPVVSGPYPLHLFLRPFSIRSRMGDHHVVAVDWRDERIAELEAQSARKDVRIAELEGQVATLTAQVAALTKQVAELMGAAVSVAARVTRNMPPSSDSPGTRHGSLDLRARTGQGRRKRRGAAGAWRLAPHAAARSRPGRRGRRRGVPSHCEGCADELTAVARSRGASGTSRSRCRRSSRTPRSGAATRSRAPGAGTRHRAPYDAAKIPASPFGPRLMATRSRFSRASYHGQSPQDRRAALGAARGPHLPGRAQRGRGAGQRRDRSPPLGEDAWRRVSVGAVKHNRRHRAGCKPARHARSGRSTTKHRGDGLQDPRRQRQGDASSARSTVRFVGSS